MAIRSRARLTETSNALAHEFGQNGQSLLERLESGGAQAVEAIRLHGDLYARLTETSNALAHEFGQNGQSLLERLDTGGAQAVEAIRLHGDSVRHRLTEDRATRSRASSARTVQSLLERLG